MKKLIQIGLIFLLIGVAVSAFADTDTDTPETEPEAVAESRAGVDRIGVVFNAPSILFEIDRYQKAGVGLKTVWGQRALRSVFGLEATGSDSLRGTLGTTFEYHPVAGRVSPYLGGSIVLSYEKEDVGDTEWTEFGFSIGPVLGVEFTLVEGAAVFAEYTLSFDGVRTSSDDEQTWNYLFGTRLGNQGSLGIVVYFPGFRARAQNGPDEAES
ncbi:MAG: hypothetical protein EA426_00705 [Spirochaetaceae bacterium]|nr:MAG: hypothetical protein EA426_00705 [Spirochaetaceae bacterium]